jgi:hypothetical protein
VERGQGTQKKGIKGLIPDAGRGGGVEGVKGFFKFLAGDPGMKE